MTGTPAEALAQALAYRDGVRTAHDGVDFARDAEIVMQQLARRGFVVCRRSEVLGLVAYAPQVIVSRTLTPAEIKQARETLRLSHNALAREAGLAKSTIIYAEKPGAICRPDTQIKIVEAFLRLGATLASDVATTRR